MTLLKVLMMTRQRVTRSTILAGTTSVGIRNDTLKEENLCYYLLPKGRRGAVGTLQRLGFVPRGNKYIRLIAPGMWSWEG